MKAREVRIESDTAWTSVVSSSSEAGPIDLENLHDTSTVAILSVPPRSKVLVVGSGSGVMARALAARGCQVWGIDVDATAIRLAERWCEGVLLEDVETADLGAFLGSQRADVILLAGILERLRDPAAALRRLVPLLAPSGRIILSAPHAAYAPARALESARSFSWTSDAMPDLFRHAGVRVIDEVCVDVTHNEPRATRSNASFPREVFGAAATIPDAEVKQVVLTVIPDAGPAVQPLPTLVSTLSEHLSRAEGRCRQLQERVHELEGHVEGLRSEHHRLRAALEEAREWHRRSAESVAAVTEDLRRSDAERRRSEEQLARATDDLASCQLERRFLRDDVMVKDAYLTALREQDAQRQQSVEETRVLTTRLGTLSSDHVAAVARIDELTSRLAAEMQRGDGLATELAAERKRAAEWAQTNDQLRQQFGAVQQELHRVHVAVAETVAQPRYRVADRLNGWLRRAGFLHAAMKRAWRRRP